MVFIDLKKTLDRVPREILKWMNVMHVNVVEDTYATDNFSVRVEMQ